MPTKTRIEKRAEWIYDHFQGISRRSDQILVLFGVLVVSTMAVWLSSDQSIELPFIKVSAGREILLGFLIVSAALTLVAFFGNYDMGEFALDELAAELECEYEELWFVDTYPSLVDFARYRRAESSNKRWLPSRTTAALLYPMVLLGALSYLTFVWGYEVFLQQMSIAEVVAFGFGVPSLCVAWSRGGEYFSRRFKTFLAAERARKQSVSSA